MRGGGKQGVWTPPPIPHDKEKDGKCCLVDVICQFVTSNGLQFFHLLQAMDYDCLRKTREKKHNSFFTDLHRGVPLCIQESMVLLSHNHASPEHNTFHHLQL